MLFVTTALSGLLALQPASPLAATVQDAAPQTAPTPEPDQPSASSAADASEAVDLGTLTVTGRRLRGAVATDIAPIQSLDAEELQAYGAATIEELLTYLEPVTRSSRGRGDNAPVTLINGRRTTGFREIARIPTEAIDRVDVLPEAVALQFGYRADQRVVNFVLKPDFKSYTFEGRVGGATEGGRGTTSVSAGYLNIAGPNRYALDVRHDRSNPLFETERDVIRDPASGPYDLIGNVTRAPLGAEIDPALSALIGETAFIAPAPLVSVAPTLEDFAEVYDAPRSGDLTAYRTLLSASEQLQVRGSVKRDLNSTTQATVSADLQSQETESFNGLPGLVLSLSEANRFSPFAGETLIYRYLEAPAALARRTQTLTGNAGVVLDGFIGETWRWTFNGGYDRVETDTSTGRGFSAAPFQARLNADDPTANPFADLAAADFAPLAADTATALSQTLSAELNLNGGLFFMPAGEVRSTFTLGADRRSLDSVSVRSGTTTERSQSRDRLNGQASFDIPLTSREEVLARVGDLSMNINLGYEELSDFGGLPTLGVVFNWEPTEKLSFLASYTDEQGAPSVSQLNDPVISTPGAPVFDFRTGETVLVTRIDGGNADLVADNRRVQQLGVTFEPLSERNLRLTSTWTRSVTQDPINAFPTVTPDLEAALPERFVRDADGVLVSFDARPINFDRAERQDIRSGLTFSMPFGTARPTTGVEAEAQIPRGGGGRRARGAGARAQRSGAEGASAGRGGGSRMGGRGGQPGQGRWNFSLFHTYRLQDEIVIRDGLPTLDLLDGAATSSRGGSPRHELQLQTGVFKDGFGAFLNANWRGSTRIDGGTGPDLLFEDQATVNLNMFVDLNQRTYWVERWPWLKGARVSLNIQNVFDSEPTVRSAGGEVPLNYQPDFLDPQGRTVTVSLRKILF